MLSLCAVGREVTCVAAFVDDLVAIVEDGDGRIVGAKIVLVIIPEVFH